jgi:tetratricopeptide (TPR) repeat protein
MSILKFGGHLWLLFMALLFAMPAAASDNPAMDAQVARISIEWARIKYQVPDKSAKYNQIHALAGQAAAVVARFPGRAEPLLWQGIVVSEEAGLAGTFQQLGLATNARKLLERAEAIDPKAANGGILLSLGVLYYSVPGFPIGFGSSKKAKTYLQRALAIDANGLETNYFYGTFLLKLGDRAGAKTHFERALRAPGDSARPVWDAGRRRDVREELKKLG